MWHVYILASQSRVLYTGVSNRLVPRVYRHKQGLASKFTSKYRVTRLVYAESERAVDAFEREKQIKRWRREKKIALIESVNPDWRDLWVEMLRTEQR